MRVDHPLGVPSRQSERLKQRIRRKPDTSEQAADFDERGGEGLGRGRSPQAGLFAQHADLLLALRLGCRESKLLDRSVEKVRGICDVVGEEIELGLHGAAPVWLWSFTVADSHAGCCAVVPVSGGLLLVEHSRIV